MTPLLEKWSALVAVGVAKARDGVLVPGEAGDGAAGEGVEADLPAAPEDAGFGGVVPG